MTMYFNGCANSRLCSFIYIQYVLTTRKAHLSHL